MMGGASVASLLHRITCITLNASGMYAAEWGYNSADLVTWMKYPDGNNGEVGEQVDFDYYPQMALKRVTGTATYLDEAKYDPLGRMITRKLGSLPATTYSYYDITTQGGRLMNTITGSLQTMTYTYDENGNIEAITDGRAGGDVPLTFGYDAANRLTEMLGGGTTLDTPGYDGANGNLNQKRKTDAQHTLVSLGYLDDENSLSNVDDTKPHAVKSMGGNQYGYDANGNMTTRVIGGVTYTLTYDAENRLVGYAGGSVNAAFVYDGDGRRVKGTVNGVVTTYVGNHYEVQGTTTRKYYFAGAQRIAVREIVGEINTLFFFLPDHLGSTAITVEDDGDFHGEMRYSAWGETREGIGETPTSRRFTGQAQEELLGIYFFEARWLDPGLGRFLSPDTIIPGAGNPQAWDRYAYVNNNSVNSTDSSGHCIDGITTIICAMAIGAVVSVAVDAFVTTQIKHEEYTWQRAGVAALTGVVAGGIGAAVIAPLAAATGAVAATTFTGIAGQATRAAVMEGTELAVGTVLSAEANIFISSAQRTANQALDGKAVSLDTYKANIQENMWTDAGFGALGYGLGSSIGKGISSTFPIRPSNGPIPGWNNNPVQKIFIGTGQAAGMAVSNSTLLDFLFKPPLPQPQSYQSGYKPVNGF